MAQVYTRTQTDTLLAGKADTSALAGKADASTVSKNTTDISAARAFAVGYATQAVSGSSTITVTQGTYALDVSGSPTLTLSAANGVAVSLDVVLASGASLTITDGPTITTSGVYTLLRSRGVWKSGATSSTSTGTGTGTNTGTGTGTNPGSGTTTPTADTTAPTAPTVTVKSATKTTLTVTVSGGTDAVGVTQYRAMAGTQAAWATRSGAGDITLSGLAAGTSYTISAQAGDAAGNWSPSTTANGSTSAAASGPTTYTSYTNGLAPVLAYDLNGNATSTGSNTASATPSTQSAYITGGVINEYAKALQNSAQSALTVDYTTLRFPALTGSQATFMMLVNLSSESSNSSGTNFGALLLNYEGTKVGQNNDGFGISVTPTTKALRAYSKNITIQGADGGFTYGAPHLVGLRFDGSTMSLWLDGVKVGSQPHTAAPTWQDPMSVGFVSFLTGLLNGVRVWTSALTDAQMLGAAQAAGLA